MSVCRPKHSPLDPGTYLHLNDNIVSKVEYDTISTKAKSDLYREIVGSLMYLMIGTRPDLAYAVGYLSRYLSNHNRSHMNAALHVLRYLKYTSTIGISYSNTATLELTGYSDSDWASDLDTRRSTTGYLFIFAGGPISWESKRQQSVALSSSEAEYMALSAAAQEAIALRALCSEFDISTSQPIKIWEDNNGAIAMSKNPITKRRSIYIYVITSYVSVYTLVI